MINLSPRNPTASFHRPLPQRAIEARDPHVKMSMPDSRCCLIEGGGRQVAVGL